MKILITGAKGFVGKNLSYTLENMGKYELFLCDIDTSKEELRKYTSECDFVYHLAGVHRPEDEEEYMKVGFGFTEELLGLLQKNNNKAPILVSSSIQAALDNPYGKSKKAGEDLIFNYGKQNDVKTFVYRLPNLFGKWSRPNYNSVVSTFCYNIASGLPIQINDSNYQLTISYIDDVVNEFISILDGEGFKEGNYYDIPNKYVITLGELADQIKSFRDTRKNLEVPNMLNELSKKLYSTYISYINEDDFAYALNMHCDQRGSFTEILKLQERGQMSVNISKPGITKGNHWHHTKVEKFLVVKGEAILRFRRIDTDKLIEYNLNGDELKIVDIPTGYTHNITNIGNEDMVFVIWTNEYYNPEKPDTFYVEV